jgi:hypothetical protein
MWVGPGSCGVAHIARCERPLPARSSIQNDEARDRKIGIDRWAPLASACSNARRVSCRPRTVDRYRMSVAVYDELLH